MPEPRRSLELPEGLNAITPATMMDSELREIHVRLGAWIEAALTVPAEEAPSDEEFDSVYHKLSEISAERADRQVEDRGTSDGGRM